MDATSLSAQSTGSKRNVLVFVADGLRFGSVNPTDAPTLTSLRQQGVEFTNSHSLFPTFTTPNASAIATGHYLGDTGDFSNTLYSGFPTPSANGSPTPFIENNPVLGDLNAQYNGNFDPSDPDSFSFYNFLNEDTLLQAARGAGFSTAAVGKLGPTLIQDVSQGTVDPSTGKVPVPQTIVIDDSTGKTGGIPLNADLQQRLIKAGVGIAAPDRSNGANTSDPTQAQLSNGFSGSNTTPGTQAANYVQQQYFVNATTQAILPEFKDNGNPFAMVYWSRDPDGTQHNQGDSLNSLTPGINGPTSKAAIQNADANLAQIIQALKDQGLYDNTDIFVTSDHGFSTISKSGVDAQGTKVNDYASTLSYKGVNPGQLPAGFVAIDLAHGLGQNLFDPDQATKGTDGNYTYKLLNPTQGDRPNNGNGLIASSTTLSTPNATTAPPANVIVAANGGSDLVYIPDHNAETLKQVVDILTKENYVSGLFVDDAYGPIAGTLPLSSINLKGSAQTPTPAIVINFKTFSTDASNPNQSEVEIADTTLQQGQGMHGSFGRGDTLNNMIAIGPDFKRGFVDSAPVSNADVAPTLASILGLNVPTSNGDLVGRVISEALNGNPDSVDSTSGVLKSSQALNGQRTYLNYQQVGDTKYFDAAGFANGTVGLNTGEKHVLLLSIDGLRNADLADPNLQADLPNILSLEKLGVLYTNASTSSPSDSFPGILSYLTGAGPATTGVYYDDSYARNLIAPGGKAGDPTGTEVLFDESIDKDSTLLSGGGDFGVGSIDTSKLPLDASGNPVYPHQYVNVNNIFDVAKAAGLYTAYSDKHPGGYDIVNGQSGNAIEDYYSPEIAAKVAIDPTTGKLIDASNNPNNLPLASTTTSVQLTKAYDDLKVQAILNEIKGLNSTGTTPEEVPNLFGMNFQALSVGQKVLSGGIAADGTPSADLQDALKHTDQSIGEIVDALKQQGLYDSTLIVLTAKHGQNPRLGSASLVKDDVLTNTLKAFGIGVAQATQDDISLIWLKDPSQAPQATAILNLLKQVNNPGIDTVFSGDSLQAAGFGTPGNDRTPDLIVKLDPGVVLVGNPSKPSKQAEHGGLSPDDLNVGLILGGGLVPGSAQGEVNNQAVSTKQIAVTALDTLGLDPAQLQGAVAEKTQALPV